MSSPPKISLAATADLIRKTTLASEGFQGVLLPGGAMEAQGLQAAFAERPDLAAGLTFSGLFVPGVNRFDWAALHPTTHMIVAVPSSDWATTISHGRTIALPVHYSAFARWIGTAGFKVQILHLSPPDSKGYHSMGFSGDVLAGDAGPHALKIGIINAAVPQVRGAPRLHTSTLDVFCEHDAPLREVPTTANAATSPDSLIDKVVAEVEDGATIQIGIGRLPRAILAALSGRTGLRLHSGLVGGELETLLDGNYLAHGDNSIACGLVLGDAQFYARMAEEPRLRLLPVRQTHGATHLAGLARFTAINAGLEIDLSGQINCEYAGSRHVSGVGGALDFMRGAQLSKRGKAITMIQAEGKDGTSRIVQRLSCETISIPRADVDIVISEYGTAHLRYLSPSEREAAIINLAAPQHRSLLDR